MTQRGAYGTQQAASAVTFTVAAPTAGMYTISARYAAAREYNWTLSVYVNGVDVTQAQFATTASWESWGTQMVTVALPAGATNTITYKYDSDDSGWINLDYITVSPAASSGYSAGSAASGALPSEIGVNKFTGTATFDASLYTVTIPGFSLPIALHYSGSGVQADDTGGEVGLNWSLQAAPSIHRQVRDLPDDIQFVDSNIPESRYGWLRYPTGSPSPATRIASIPDAPAALSSTGCTPDEQNALTLISAFGALNHTAGNSYSLYDTEPDIFTYAVPGYSGKFIFDGLGTIRLLPYAPLQITPLFTAQTASCPVTVPAGELTGFTIKTTEGIVYTFNLLERISQQAQSTASFGGTKYLLRHFWDFKINQYSSGPTISGPTNLAYTTGWLATQITTPVANANAALKAANSISFEYDCSTYTPPAQLTSNMYLLGSATTVPSADQSLATVVVSSPKLMTIRTATAVVTLSRELDESDNFHVTTLAVTSPLELSALVKSYTFQYVSAGRFLRKLLLNRATSTLPLYTFTYAADVYAAGALPASHVKTTNANRDYWGYANRNLATTGIPRLYVYPQLLSGSSLRPAAPYRLYPAPDYESGGLVLAGADRRPANRLSVSVAGSMTSITFATGGKVVLGYEQNQFYDPVAQQSLPAGGIRIRTIKVQDPVTLVETRRDYSYQQAGANNAGVSSGVLLHIPRFAFVMPLTTSSQWADVTVRTIDEVAPDPFESRPVGYQQVTEIVPGKGQVTTSFSVPGGADDNTSPADGNSHLPAWNRPIFGVARQQTNSNCPAVTPLQTVS